MRETKLIPSIIFIIVLNLGRSIGDVSDVTTVHKFNAAFNSHSEEQYKHFHSKFNIRKKNGWQEVDFARVEFNKLFSDEVKLGNGENISPLVLVPTDEFVISFQSISSRIFVFLLSGNDINKSDMIMLNLTSESVANLCEDYLESNSIMLPNNITRKCISFELNYRYKPSYDSRLYIHQKQGFSITASGNQNLASEEVIFDDYKKEMFNFNIKYVAIGVYGGTAHFKIMPSFQMLSLSRPRGLILVDNGLSWCVSLTYFLEPMSGAYIRLFITSSDTEETIKIGEVTAPQEDPLVASMSTQEFVFDNIIQELGQPIYLKIEAIRNSETDKVLIVNITNCDIKGFPKVRTFNKDISTEIHTMGKSRGLPIFTPKNGTLNSFIGAEIDECTTLKCTWTATGWIQFEQHQLPLKLSEKQPFMEYVNENMSVYHIFNENHITFSYEMPDVISNYNLKFKLFLLSSNENMEKVNMYIILRYINRNEINIFKCTYYHHYSDRIQIPGETIERERYCSLENSKSMERLGNHCQFDICYTSGNIKYKENCNLESNFESNFEWTDPYPLDIKYFRFGTDNFPAHFILDDKAWSLGTDEGSFTSPVFIPTSNKLCVSLAYNLQLAAETSLKLSAHWTDGEVMEFEDIPTTTGWITERIILELPSSKYNKPVTVKLTATQSENNTVLVQRVAGCNSEGNEDILILSRKKTADIENFGYDVAVTHQKNFSLSSTRLDCTNGGIFDEEQGGCICPVGFTGLTCRESCGANRFGASCNGQCSMRSDACSRKIFCRPALGCNCASGFKGIYCDVDCDVGEYGSGCLQNCGKCKERTCDGYSGTCPNGCEIGYYPPFCQDVYKYFTVAPKIVKGVNGFTISADLKDTQGSGIPKFYKIQYRDLMKKQHYWTELQPQILLPTLISSYISGLSFGITYEIRIVLIDMDGNSYEGSKIASTNITTGCTVPASVDYMLEANDIAVKEVSLTWKYTPEDNSSCPVKYFEVEYKHEVQWIKFYEGPLTSTTFSDLLSGQEYEIRVRAVSVQHLYPFSHILKVKTHDGVPGAVQNISIISIKSNSVTIKWNPPTDTATNIHRYKVAYECLKLLECQMEDCRFSFGQVEVKTNSVEIRGLQSHAQYSFSISALSAEWGREKQLLVLTNMSVPEVTPQSKSPAVTDGTNSSFTVHWDSPKNCTKINGYLYGYYYELWELNKTTLLEENNTHLTSASFSDLAPHTSYIVKVYVRTSGRWNSNYALEIHAQTRATTPDAVQQLEVYKRSRRMLGFRWAPPKHMYGKLDLFKISLKFVEGNNESFSLMTKPESCVAWPHLYCYTATKLRPDTRYSISVQAQNSEVDDVGEIASVIGTTKEAAPGPPSYINVISQMQQSLQIEWGLPHMINGILRSFVVNVEETDSFNSSECCQYFPVKEVTIQSEKSGYQLEFADLAPAASYTISVSAKTVALGPSLTISTFTRPPVPSTDNLLEIPENPNTSPGILTVLINPITEYKDLVSGYLLLVKPHNDLQIPKTVIFDDWLNREITSYMNGTFYFAAEFNQMELEENNEVIVGTGYGLKVGKLGEVQNPGLENEEDYTLHVIIVLDYHGVMSTGHAQSRLIHVDY